MAKKNKIRPLNISLIFISSVLLIVIVVVLSQSFFKQESTFKNYEITPGNKVTLLTKTYTNSEYGYEVKYPDLWEIDTILAPRFPELKNYTTKQIEKHPREGGVNWTEVMGDKPVIGIKISVYKKGDRQAINLGNYYQKNYKLSSTKFNVGDLDTQTYELERSPDEDHISYRLLAENKQFVVDLPIEISNIESEDINSIKEINLINQILSTFKFLE